MTLPEMQDAPAGEGKARDVLIVVDMQQGLLRGAPKRDLDGVVSRINRLAARIRERGGAVFFIQHAGKPGEDFEPRTPGWELLHDLEVAPSDIVVSKTLNDPFVGTTLHSALDEVGPARVLVAGWATDFCVDACVRTAAAFGYQVVAIADCHTLSDRAHLAAADVIRHHHWIW